MKTYYVYILSSKSGVLYVGITSDLFRRLYEHKNKLIDGFTKRYSVNRLVYFEETNDIQVALAREKEIKAWRRQKKIDLVKTSNPQWEDLAEDWFEVNG